MYGEKENVKNMLKIWLCKLFNVVLYHINQTNNIMAHNLEELTSIVLAFDKEDVETIFIDDYKQNGKCKVDLNDHEIYFDDDIVFVTGTGYVEENKYGGGEEPVWIDYDVDFDVIISANDLEGNEVKASFCNLYPSPKKI